LRFLDDLRERGLAEAVSRITEDAFDSLQPVTSAKKACELTGRSRATLYRRRAGTRQGCRERRPAPPNALAAGERQEALDALGGPRFADKAPRQVWALLIDEGPYLASTGWTLFPFIRCFSWA
jgi:putative transposase